MNISLFVGAAIVTLTITAVGLAAITSLDTISLWPILVILTIVGLADSLRKTKRM